MHTTSASLLKRLRRPGQTEAWSRFVRLYSPMLHAWACQMGLQDADAADLVQDVFVTLFQKLPEFDYDHHQRFRGWLWTITRNKWKDRCKRRPLPKRRDDFLTREPAPATESFEETELRQHLMARILSAVQNRFEPATWQAFWKHVVEGRPAAEVAKELGVKAGTVYMAKCRVFSYLSKEYKGMDFDVEYMGR